MCKINLKVKVELTMFPERTRNMESKPRILYLLRILEQFTDEEHPLTTRQLIEMLDEQYGISTYRTTIAKDITVLQEFGIDIIIIHSTQCKYFIGSRQFELPELKLLVDAVESSKFITSKKSEALISKIHMLTSSGQRKKLKRNNYVSGRIKPNNEQIYYIVDTINDAINAKKQISYQYYEYTGSKEKVLKNQGEIYTISPYHLVWNDDYYYVVGYSEKWQRIVTFRVDRIAAQPEILTADAFPIPEGFEIAEYTKQVFYMYDGEDVTTVNLQCDNSLMKTMIDRFGEDVSTVTYNATSFQVNVKVSVSPTFFGWIFGFGGKIQILAPESVKEQYRQMILQASGNIK